MAARAIPEIIPELVRYYEAFFRGGLRILSHIDIASNLVDCFENSGIVLGNVGEVWSSILGSATSLPTVKSLGELTTTTTMSNHVVVSQLPRRES